MNEGEERGILTTHRQLPAPVQQLRRLRLPDSRAMVRVPDLVEPQRVQRWLAGSRPRHL